MAAVFLQKKGHLNAKQCFFLAKK